MLEDEKGKEVRTYSDVFYARRYTYRLSNGEEYSKFKNFWEKSFKKMHIDKITVCSGPDHFESSLHVLGFMTRGEMTVFEIQQT